MVNKCFAAGAKAYKPYSDPIQGVDSAKGKKGKETKKQKPRKEHLLVLVLAPREKQKSATSGLKLAVRKKSRTPCDLWEVQ